MNNKRLLFLTMVVLTLSFGVIIGTIVSGGVKATSAQTPATLVIPDPVSLSNAFSQIAAQLEPAVVNISVESTAPERTQRRQVPQIPGLPPDLFNFDFGDEPQRTPRAYGTGTGFIVDKAGFIVTNHHVVERASKIKVRLFDNSEFTATLVGSDPATDLAVIKIDTGRELATARFGNSDAVRTGDWVLAIGSPFGFDHTVTSGIISAKGRDNRQFGANVNNAGLQTFLQTDAAINPGNSGGPLVNMSGEVIGVNTAIVSGTDSFAGLGFALPSNTAVNVYNQLSQHGKVTRGSIGISYMSETDPRYAEAMMAFGLKPGDGMIVTTVFPDKPAAKAGIQANDIITEIDGKKITVGNQLLDIVAGSAVGSTLQVKFLRDGRVQTAAVTVGDRNDILPSEEAQTSIRELVPENGRGAATSKLGIQVQPLTSQLTRQSGVDQGVVVSSVTPDSVAEEAGLTRAAIITSIVINGRVVPVNNIEDFRRLEADFKPGTSLIIRHMELNPQTNRYEAGGFTPMTVR